MVDLARGAVRRELRDRRGRGRRGRRRRRPFRAHRQRFLPFPPRLGARRGTGLRAGRNARGGAQPAAQPPGQPAPRGAARAVGLHRLVRRRAGRARAGPRVLAIAIVVWRTGDAAAGTGEADALGTILRLRGRYEDPAEGAVVDWRTRRTLTGFVAFAGIGFLGG